MGISDHAMTDTDIHRRARVRARTDIYRQRRRHGRVLVAVEVTPRQIEALERLALLEAGERGKARIAGAVARFLDGAAHIAALGDTLWPEAEAAKAGE